MHVFKSISVDDILLPSYELIYKIQKLNEEIALPWLKHMNCFIIVHKETNTSWISAT